MPPIRVVVVDDSALVRDVLVGLIEEDRDIKVVGQAAGGEEAVAMVRDLKPDLITLDLGLPDIDGFEVARRVMAETPTPILVLTATLTPRDRPEAFHALSLGALHVLEKPEASLLSLPQWRRGFREDLRALAKVTVGRRLSAGTHAPRPKADVRPAVVTIVASAGGPAAVQQLLLTLPPLPVPIVTAFHVGANLGDSLSRYLAGHARMPVEMAREGENLMPGRIYVTPGRRQVEFASVGRLRFFDDVPADTLYAPSFDLFLKSAARWYGPRAVAAIMSGMGDDGVAGLLAMRAKGAMTVGQDADTCIVYGMPKAAKLAGAIVCQLTPPEMAAQIMEWVTGGER